MNTNATITTIDWIRNDGAQCVACRPSGQKGDGKSLPANRRWIFDCGELRDLSEISSGRASGGGKRAG
jgi:hypothetical protein